MMTFRDRARGFLEKETQFHLGELPSEQSNPKTRGLDVTFAKSIEGGVRQLQTVDRDLVAMADRMFASDEYCELVESIVRAINGDHQVVISSCGASGRLSIMIEACWRKFWQRLRAEHPSLLAKCKDRENQVFSIMTGGDYALVRSVENFEDYAEFGRQQTRELQVGAGDCLIALNEAGETNSVYGSVDEALEVGAEVFLVYNNPTEVLSRCLDRARRAIEDPRVTNLPLYGGAMAVAGSTRMQATTSELLVVGTAMEEALYRILGQELSAEELERLGVKPMEGRAAEFGRLLDDLGSDESVVAIAGFIGLEEEIYGEGGMVTYYADELLLDIFTDTTERAPTFMLPPFRKCDDKVSVPSWAFVKNPLYGTKETWQGVYGRLPRCLDWDTALYYEIGIPAEIAESPPLVYLEELYKFAVGNEEDDSRLRSPAAAVAVRLSSETQTEGHVTFEREFDQAAAEFDIVKQVVIGAGGDSGGDIVIPVRIADSQLRIMQRLAAKLVLNTLSTGTMVRMGRVKSNWMWWVDTSNKKLIDRSIRLIVAIVGVDYERACYALFETFEEFENTDFTGRDKPSPAQYTIRRMTKG